MNGASTKESRFIRLATAAAFAGLFSYAVVFTVTSASINEVGRYFDATPATLGWLFRALMIGFFGGALVAGRFSDRYGKLQAIWPGCIAMVAGMCLFVNTSDFRMALLSTLLMGAGGGASEASAMALISDLYAGSRRVAMANWSQAAFAFGAIACPFAVGWLLKTGIAWQASYYGGAAVCAVSAALTLVAMATGKENVTQVHENGADIRKLLSDRLVLLLAISLMLYVGAETGTANWLAVYFKHDLNSAPAMAAWSVAVFWTGIALGRIATGWISKHVAVIPFTRWCFIIAAAFQALLLLAHSPVSGLAAVFILGMCLGPIFPTLASCAGAAYPGQSGAALGIVVASGSIGGAIFPPTIGLIADHTGMRLAMWISFAVILMNLVALGLLKKRDIARISGA